LKGGTFELEIAGSFVHGATPLYRMYNMANRSVQQMFYAPQPIRSNSSIIPEITDSPPSQNLGSLASSPNGFSSSE
jgi:hypothetical protein